MNRQIKKAALASAVAAALGAGASVATADSILFPYMVKGNTVTTLATIINEADVSELHYTWSYKTPVAGESEDAQNARPCTHFDNTRITSKNDIVTFDAGRMLGDDNHVLFDDTGAGPGAEYDGKFGLVEDQWMGTLIVDNNENQSEADQTLSGEALVLEWGSGAAWGYAAYNSDQEDAYTFAAANARYGEVLTPPNPRGNPIDIVPLKGENATWVERLFVTPIDNVGDNQDALDLTVFVHFGVPEGGDLLAYNRDEDEVSMRVKKAVKCVGRITLTGDSVFAPSVKDEMPNGGWTWVWTAAGSLPAPATYTPTDEAIIQKLEYNVTDEVLGGVVNTAEWLREPNP